MRIFLKPLSPYADNFEARAQTFITCLATFIQYETVHFVRRLDDHTEKTSLTGLSVAHDYDDGNEEGEREEELRDQLVALCRAAGFDVRVVED